jgi:hypothetical protein
MSKIIEIRKTNDECSDKIIFDSGHELYSYHSPECCEEHFLNFQDLDLKEISQYDFDLSGSFFEKVPNSGIRLLPVNGLPVFIPGYSDNNGYYTDNLTLILKKDDKEQCFLITECQRDRE